MEDGYTIVDDFDEYQKLKIKQNTRISMEIKQNILENYIPFSTKIMRDTRNKELIEKYSSRNAPIWVLLEIMSYGKLASFVEFYYKSGKFK